MIRMSVKKWNFRTAPLRFGPSRFGPSHLARVAMAMVAAMVAAAWLAVLPALSGTAQAQSLQQQWVGDLPIMEGMAIEPELGFAFDSPGGRIVLVFAASGASEADVLAYYNAALASLGWAGGDGSWRRGGESLTLARVDTGAGRLWRIRLSPN